MAHIMCWCPTVRVLQFSQCADKTYTQLRVLLEYLEKNREDWFAEEDCECSADCICRDRTSFVWQKPFLDEEDWYRAVLCEEVVDEQLQRPNLEDGDKKWALQQEKCCMGDCYKEGCLNKQMGRLANCKCLMNDAEVL